MRRSIYIFLLSTLCYSCSKYSHLHDRYAFRSKDGKPAYNNLDYWAAHPAKWDPSDSIPQPLLQEPRDSMVDVFFLHPTTYTGKRKTQLNAAIDDEQLNARTDYSTILYQASVFNAQCRVFAPRYRQAHISNFYPENRVQAIAAFDTAYEDLKTAFEYYLQTWNGNRPLIIAAHSQGSLHAERLLKEYFDHPPARYATLKNRLVVAYIWGWQIPTDLFTRLTVCNDSFQTGCICGWRTLRKGYVPRYLRNENGNSWVTNPLSWTTGSEPVSRHFNKGSVLTNFNKIYYRTTDATISNGFLYVRKPKFPGSIFYLTRNYHVADINLFYMNTREDIKRRIGLFWKQ